MVHDLRALLQQGLILEAAVAAAAVKEAGADAGTLAWALETFPPPSGEPEDLRRFRGSSRSSCGGSGSTAPGADSFNARSD